MNSRTKMILSMFLGAFLLAGMTAMASAQKKETVPGWGYGDDNHVHTGPPGQSVRVNPGS